MKYTLHDLEITTVGDPKTFNCSHVVGEGLFCKGENISFKPNTKQFSHYVLATLMPYIAAKQRVTDKNDWMYYESDISCPDPQCGAKFRFIRTSNTRHKYDPLD